MTTTTACCSETRKGGQVCHSRLGCKQGSFICNLLYLLQHGARNSPPTRLKALLPRSRAKTVESCATTGVRGSGFTLHMGVQGPSVIKRHEKWRQQRRRQEGVFSISILKAWQQPSSTAFPVRLRSSTHTFQCYFSNTQYRGGQYFMILCNLESKKAKTPPY